MLVTKQGIQTPSVGVPVSTRSTKSPTAPFVRSAAFLRAGGVVRCSSWVRGCDQRCGITHSDEVHACNAPAPFPHVFAPFQMITNR